MISQYIPRHAARLPPAVGVGVPDDPSLSSPPVPRCRRGCGRRGRPQRGDPRRGSPLYPLLRFISTGEFRALRRAARGAAPGPRPLFCKKAGQKTFTWLDFYQPKPLAAAASDPIRPRSGHLSGRVAPPTRVGEAGGSRNLTGAPPPKSAFLWGSTPFLWASTKEMGWNRSTNVKSSRSKRRVPETPNQNPYST